MAIRRILLSCVLLPAGLLIGACSSKPIVGVILPSTGEASQYGESIESGARLAITEAREKGQLPPKFEVLWADSGSDPDTAVKIFRDQVENNGAKVILGGATSAEARALIPVINELQIICLSPSASAPGLTRLSKYFYRLYPSDEIEGQTAGKFMTDRLKAPNVLLLAGNSEYASGIESEFRKEYVDHGKGSISARIEMNDEGWEARIRKALRAKPGAVYIVGYSDEIIRAIRVIRKTGYKGRIVTTSAFFISKAVKEAGEIADGVLFPLPPFDRNSEKEPVLSFVHHYMDAYQRAPDVFSAHGYDAMNLLLEILREAHPSVTPQLAKELHFGLTNFVGVTGPILFDDYGDVRHYPKMFIYKDGVVQGYEHYLEVKRKQIIQQVGDLLAN